MRHRHIILAACACACACALTTPAPSSRAQTPAPSSRAQTPAPASAPTEKRATAKTRRAVAAVSAEDGDSTPQLISTTGGSGSGSAASAAKTWDSIAALQKAADAGDPDACYELGNRYLAGDKDIPQNATRAMIYFQDAARHGNRDAAFRLGKMYSDGGQIPRDYAKALEYYTAAARAGDAIAQHNLGAMYSSGRGVKYDYAEGLAWLIIAARRAPEAADGEKKLRAFLASINRPDLVAAGETRARELTQELADAKAAEKTDAHPATATGAKPALIKTDPIKIEPIKMPVPSLESLAPEDIN